MQQDKKLSHSTPVWVVLKPHRMKTCSDFAASVFVGSVF